MPTTFEDVLQEEAEKHQYQQEELDKEIINRKGSLITEQAVEIHDYLPVARNPAEQDYVLHLWDAFLTLDTLGGDGRPFFIMPFHLLFMLSLQYKILRIAKTHDRVMKIIISSISGRNRSILLKSKRSVFDVALINERTMPEIFGLIEVADQDILKIKNLVDNRNDNLAHAKGWVELEPEDKIQEYLEVLKHIQEKFLEMNDIVAEDWLKEMGTGDEGEEYMQTHFLEEYLCPADMQQGKLAELDKRLNGEI